MDIDIPDYYFNMGRMAWEDGFVRDQCPFDGQEGQEWLKGYDSRQHEMEKKIEQESKSW